MKQVIVVRDHSSLCVVRVLSSVWMEQLLRSHEGWLVCCIKTVQYFKILTEIVDLMMISRIQVSRSAHYGRISSTRQTFSLRFLPLVAKVVLNVRASSTADA